MVYATGGREFDKGQRLAVIGKSKRARLGEAVRSTCRPLLYELGFRNPRKHDRDRWGRGTRLDVFLRWRGVDLDEIEFDWAGWNRPSFRIPFSSHKFERNSEGCPTEFRSRTTGSVCVQKLFDDWAHFEWFGPWRSPRSAAKLASVGLLELDAYFLHGLVGPHVSLGVTARMGPGLNPPPIPPWWRRFGDPALDPERDVAQPG
jgi:hypothetical protein